MATIAHIKDPFRPQLNPILYELDEPKTINRLLFEQGLIDRKGTRKSAFVVCVDGDYKLQDDWAELIKPTSTVATIELPPYVQGGGGGSNPMRIVLMVAVVVASIYTGGAAAGWATAAGYGPAAAQAIGGLASMAVMMGGSMLINALVPQAQLQGPQDAQVAKTAYFLGSQQNSIEKGAPIQVWYGRRRIYPALAAQPHVLIDNNEVYLHQLMCLTQGRLEIEQICIEKTAISNFSDVEYQVVEPFQDVTLFPDNVYTAPEVQDLKLEGLKSGSDMVVGYRKDIEVVRIGDIIDDEGIPKGLYEIRTTYSYHRAQPMWKGGYIATPLGVKTERLAIDVSLPRGLAKMDTQTGDALKQTIKFLAQARLIDDSNQPMGDWFNLSDDSTPYLPENTVVETTQPNINKKTTYEYLGASITASSIDPIMQTYFYKVPKGRYEVRFARMTPESDATSVSDEIHWIGVRSYMPSKRQYGNVTMLAVKMKATNNLNNNIARRINVLGTRILPVLNDTKWEEKPTRSIAWAAADILTNKEYGRGLKMSRVNLQELMRLDAVWNGRRDYFDGFFNTETNIWDALTRCVEVGRTKPVYIAGVIDFVRNEPKSLPTQMFTPENMVQDSFNIKYAFPKTGDADHVVVKYTDPISWDISEVECALPASKKLKAAVLDFSAITSREQAWREGIHRAAMNQVQREFPNWQTEMEGLALGYGSVVLAAHDVPEWGATGEIMSLDSDVIECSNDLPWSQNNVIALRGRDGSVQGTYPIARINEFTGRITGKPYISDGYSEQPTHYIFGNTERVGKKLVVTSVMPDSDNKVTVGAVVYSDYPHQVETIETMPPLVVPTGDDYAEMLVINWVKVSKSLERNAFTVTSNLARGATKYEYQVAKLPTDTFTALYAGSSPIYTGPLPFGDKVRIRARAIGSASGEWYVWQGEITEEVIEVPAAPAMVITHTDTTDLRTFDVTITADESIASANVYTVLLNNAVIRSFELNGGQSAVFSQALWRVRDTNPQSPTYGQYLPQTAVFKAYGNVDGVRTHEISQTVDY